MWLVAEKKETLELIFETGGKAFELPIRWIVHYMYVPMFLPAFGMLYLSAISSCKKRACKSVKAKTKTS